MSDLETYTDKELIKELATRHNDLIVIRPNRKKDDKLKVFTRTRICEGGEHSYDVLEAVQLLHDAQIGIMKDSLVVQE